MQKINQLLEHPFLLAYFVGANNYTWLHFKSGEQRLLAKPISYFDERLPTFLRVHKTALINPEVVVGIQSPPRSKMAGAVQLQDGTELPVSRRRWDEVRETLQPFLETIPSAAPPKTTHPEPDQVPVNSSSPVRVQAIMAGNTRLITQQCISQLAIPCKLEFITSGAELATALLLTPSENWPKLIMIDTRINRADSILALKSLKSYPILRTIPVIWLVAPGENTMQAYLLDANSVVVVPDDSASFMHTLTQLFQYWLLIAQLPSWTNPNELMDGNSHLR